ncbi:MAG: cytochrome P450 [Pseudomonadota bacterium]
MPQTAPTDVPIFDGDMFSDDGLKDPFPYYRQIRDLGPVVYLGNVGMYAVGRYEDVKKALRSSDRLVSTEGIGMNPFINNQEGRPPNIIVTDGIAHSKMKRPLLRSIGPKPIEKYRPQLKELISEHTKTLIGSGWFDGVSSLAQFLPVSVISHLVGLPEEGRKNMLRWAASTFNLLGPNLDDMEEDMEASREVSEFLATVPADSMKEGSWADDLFKAAERGELEIFEARGALATYVLPSLDTTIFAKANLIYNLGANPDQWKKLKADPSLISSAVYEGVRHSATVRGFSRFAKGEYREGDVYIPQGERVVVFFGAANRDERHYEDPDAFLVDRNPRDNLGWGHGDHLCAGMYLARLEMEVMLEALIEQVDRIDVESPVYGTNQGLYGIDAMRVQLH